MGLNQEDVAQNPGISQSRVSHIERGYLDRTEVATLRVFSEALGGELEITVKLGTNASPWGSATTLIWVFR